jgi:hypothetical protein
MQIGDHWQDQVQLRNHSSGSQIKEDARRSLFVRYDDPDPDTIERPSNVFSCLILGFSIMFILISALFDKFVVEKIKYHVIEVNVFRLFYNHRLVRVIQTLSQISNEEGDQLTTFAAIHGYQSDSYLPILFHVFNVLRLLGFSAMTIMAIVQCSHFEGILTLFRFQIDLRP